MGDRPKTSQAGSLAATFSEKLKVAEAKTFSGDHKVRPGVGVSANGSSPRRRWGGASMLPVAPRRQP
jgi:hypothetical protein